MDMKACATWRVPREALVRNVLPWWVTSAGVLDPNILSPYRRISDISSIRDAITVAKSLGLADVAKSLDDLSALLSNKWNKLNVNSAGDQAFLSTVVGRISGIRSQLLHNEPVLKTGD
jgi:hypothetical protein